MSLTEHLIAARKRAALSQGEVAEALGVSRQAVSRVRRCLAGRTVSPFPQPTILQD